MTIRNRLSSDTARRGVLVLVLAICSVHAPSLSGQVAKDRVQELTDQVSQLNAMILELREEISKARQETHELRLELQRASSERVPANSDVAAKQEVLPPAVGEPRESSQQPQSAEERLAQLEENQQLLSNRVEEQYQTKVESSSRYRTRLNGIVLLNAFANRGRVDDQEVPNLVLRRGATDTGGTLGLSALQSQVGFETYGPTIGGAKASAALQFDFFGVPASSAYGTSWGAVRLRTATMRLDWARTSVVVGQDAPFISPLSPTSIASVGYPALSFSGNLWTWTPQARVEHRFNVSETGTLALQSGIFDPIPRSSEQPGYATRLAWSHGDSDRPLTLGISGYYLRQDRGAERKVDGWTGAADWLVPLGSRVELSGEFYRGRAFGNLGAAQGRSVVSNGPESDPASSIAGLNAAGGWAQLSFKASSSVEFNAAHGEDHPFGRDLRRFIQTGVYSGSVSRNRGQMFNVIYRPRTDLVFSLEYRRLKTWRISPEPDNANHLNLGVGVLF